MLVLHKKEKKHQGKKLFSVILRDCDIKVIGSMLESVKKREILVFEIRLSLKQNQNHLKLRSKYISVIKN